MELFHNDKVVNSSRRYNNPKNVCTYYKAPKYRKEMLTHLGEQEINSQS